MDKDLSVVVTMIKEIEERLQKIHEYKKDYFEEERLLYSRLENLHNLCNKLNINILCDKINKEE